MDENLHATVTTLYSTEEIVSLCGEVKPSVVSIDAPLALPRGRCCLRDACSCRGRGHFRECDLELRKMGIRFFPVTIGPMRMLTVRGIKVRESLEGMGLKVVESYPGAAQDLLHIPRKTHGVELLRKGLIEYGVRGDISKRNLTHDELDAVTCALVGILYLQGKHLPIGDPAEIVMVLPKPNLGKAGQRSREDAHGTR